MNERRTIHRRLSNERPEAAESNAERPHPSGFTLVELLVIIAVIGIISIIIYPRVTCMIEKARLSSASEDLRIARDRIEAFEVELGIWPTNLEDAFAGKEPPKTLIYCYDGEDRNNGHGNEWCSFFDNSNPSGQNQHGGVPDAAYVLRTIDGLSSTCQNIDYLWTTCCGQDTTEVPPGGTGPNGHPGT